EYEANIIQRIYDLYLNGGYGANKIAQMLNAEGIKTKRDCKWSQNGISRILTNELYCGKIINGKEEVEDFLTSKRTKKEE
ncbi:MAG: recombinase family protein, partial [Oscillospiraceae bacterium]